MRLSPLDVRSQDFKKSLRGYDPEEVKSFLDAVADTMEDLLKEKETAEAELVGIRKKVEAFTQMEISLRDAMVAAQKAGDEARVNARRNAELMIREAELEVRQRIADAKRRVDDIFKTRDTVRAEMRSFVPRLRSLLESQLTYLANVEEEMASMGFGEKQTDEEAEDLKSLAQTVETTASEAQTEALEESVRQEEREVARREQSAAGAAPGGPEHEQPHGPSGRQGDSEAQALDRAMQSHHEKHVEHREQPAGDHGGPEQQGGPEQHAEGHRNDHAEAEPRPADSTWKPEPSKEEYASSDEELKVSHAPQEGSESGTRGDVNA